MVSRVAVMALVAVIAVPILLGFALNLNETSVTDYKTDSDTVNVTQLLQTGTAYTPANADVIKINTEFEFEGATDYYPVYDSITRTATPLKMYQEVQHLQPGGYQYYRLSSYDGGIAFFVGRGSNVTLVENSSDSSTRLHTINNMEAMFYFPEEQAIEYSYPGGSSFFYPSSTSNIIGIINNGATAVDVYTTLRSSSWSYFVDLAAGYHFVNIGASPTSKVVLNLPEKTKSVLMTMDLSTITDADYSFYVEFTYGDRYIFTKTTVAGVPNWAVTNTQTDETVAASLYYDTERASNTYQMLLNIDELSSRTNNSLTYHTYHEHAELRYIGDWPTIFGSANYYQTYSYDVEGETSAPISFNNIKIGSRSGPITSPLMRMDGAVFSAFAYSIISDKSYTPADFKTNPVTTLTNIQKFGPSIEFAGNTYQTDSDGNITLGTHKTSLNNIRFESVPVPVGYENRINGNVISVSAEPSTIKFNGNWTVNVSTDSQTATTYNTTEWTPGEFAWDGIDSNFLIVGLVTCLGVFIALGIYLRRTRSSMWPLLIVCGCAAGLFICMI